jgi:uncharacterized protein YsxB (DUF464 family)
LISIRVALDSEDRISDLHASGHEDSAFRGSAIACAGCSILLRTAYEALSGDDEVKINGKAPSTGMLSFTVRGYPEDKVGWAQGVADFLLIGLSSLEREYPSQFDIVVERNRRE